MNQEFSVIDMPERLSPKSSRWSNVLIELLKLPEGKCLSIPLGDSRFEAMRNNFAASIHSRRRRGDKIWQGTRLHTSRGDDNNMLVWLDAREPEMTK